VVALRLLGAFLAIAIAGCGGDDSPPQLVDGSRPPELPLELAELDGAVMTRTEIKSDSDLDLAEHEACGLPSHGGDRTVVERTGRHGSSLTVESGLRRYACDKIPDPVTAEDPDLPYGGIWCGAANGRVDDGKLNDPRLSLCQDTDGDLTAFAWLEPQAGAEWVVVADAGYREVYEVAAGLPVRVTTTGGTEPASSRASFDVEEYDADGTQLREYLLEAAVAG
jgi:hypothetical protein